MRIKRWVIRLNLIYFNQLLWVMRITWGRKKIYFIFTYIILSWNAYDNGPMPKFHVNLVQLSHQVCLNMGCMHIFVLKLLSRSVNWMISRESGPPKCSMAKKLLNTFEHEIFSLKLEHCFEFIQTTTTLKLFQILYGIRGRLLSTS